MTERTVLAQWFLTLAWDVETFAETHPPTAGTTIGGKYEAGTAVAGEHQAGGTLGGAWSDSKTLGGDVDG